MHTVALLKYIIHFSRTVHKTVRNENLSWVSSSSRILVLVNSLSSFGSTRCLKNKIFEFPNLESYTTFCVYDLASKTIPNLLLRRLNVIRRPDQVSIELNSTIMTLSCTCVMKENRSPIQIWNANSMDGGFSKFMEPICQGHIWYVFGCSQAATLAEIKSVY